MSVGERLCFCSHLHWLLWPCARKDIPRKRKTHSHTRTHTHRLTLSHTHIHAYTHTHTHNSTLFLSLTLHDTPYVYTLAVYTNIPSCALSNGYSFLSMTCMFLRSHISICIRLRMSFTVSRHTDCRTAGQSKVSNEAVCLG